MQGLKKLSVILLAAMLYALLLQGCAPVRTCVPTHGTADCRSCHKSGGTSGAKDFSAIYANPSSHHPVGIKYPVGPNAKSGFSSPNNNGGDIAFFDKNGNGQPDSNEIQLFGGCGAVTVECASCHVEHGNTPAPASATGNSHLRVDNAGSALCTTCHNY